MLILHLLSCLLCPPASAGPLGLRMDRYEEPLYIEDMTSVEPLRRRADRRVLLSAGAGPSASLGELDLRPQGLGRDKDGAPGPAASFQLVDRLSDDFGLGVEFDLDKRSDRSSTLLIPDFVTTVGGRSSLLMGIARLVLNPDSSVRVAAVGGFGVHSSSLRMTAAPCPDCSWWDTGTREPRTLVDSSVIGYAGALRLGLEIPLGEDFFVGGDVGYLFLHESKYKATPAAEQVGLSDISTRGKSLNAAVRLGFYL